MSVSSSSGANDQAFPLLELILKYFFFERYLEFKYKRRVYKTHHVDERCHRQLHAKANLKRFLAYVTQGSLDKVVKLTDKGLDPNFQVSLMNEFL